MTSREAENKRKRNNANNTCLIGRQYLSFLCFFRPRDRALPARTIGPLFLSPCFLPTLLFPSDPSLPSTVKLYLVPGSQLCTPWKLSVGSHNLRFYTRASGYLRTLHTWRKQRELCFSCILFVPRMPWNVVAHMTTSADSCR